MGYVIALMIMATIAIVSVFWIFSDNTTKQH